MSLKLTRLIRSVLYFCPKSRYKSTISFHRHGQRLFFNTMSSVSRPRVYVTRRIPQKGLDMLRESCDIGQWDSDEAVPRIELLKNIVDVDALFCLLTDKIDGEVLNAAGSKLKVIGTMSVGYDHINIAECAKRNIPVGYTPDVLTDATAELTVALLLATARRIPEGMAAVKSGEWGTWKPMWLCGQGLANSTVGIVGLGRIGLAVAKRLIPFGVSRFLYTGRSERFEAKEIGAEYLTLDALAQQSDFIIASCALNKDTKEMFNLNVFSQMKKSAVFVNTSRGGVVNQADLYKALTEGMIAAAGLDVTTPEPLPVTDPLLKLPNCIILPHIGSAEAETRSAMAVLTARNILAALDGRPMPAPIK